MFWFLHIAFHRHQELRTQTVLLYTTSEKYLDKIFFQKIAVYSIEDSHTWDKIFHGNIFSSVKFLHTSINFLQETFSIGTEKLIDHTKCNSIIQNKNGDYSIEILVFFLLLRIWYEKGNHISTNFFHYAADEMTRSFHTIYIVVGRYFLQMSWPIVLVRFLTRGSR